MMFQNIAESKEINIQEREPRFIVSEINLFRGDWGGEPKAFHWISMNIEF